MGRDLSRMARLTGSDLYMMFTHFKKTVENKFVNSNNLPDE
jgi:hypothetical protein